MNSLIFDPQPHYIHEWTHLYLSQQEINHFQTIIDRTCNYLDVIGVNKLKKISSGSQTDGSPLLPHLKKKGKLKRKTSIRDEGGIQQFIEDVNTQKMRFEEEYLIYIEQYKQSKRNNKISNQQEETSNNNSNYALLKKLQICEKHLALLKSKAIIFYDQFLQQEDELLETFFKFKLNELKKKKQRIKKFLDKRKTDDFKTIEESVRILFDNLYIQTEYLNMLVDKNRQLFQQNSQNDYSSDEPEVMISKQRQLIKHQRMDRQIQDLKQEIRQMYFQCYRKKKSRAIKDHKKLEKHMKSQIAIHADQHTPLSTTIAWFNGFMVAFLLVALLTIIGFRQANIAELQANSNYRIQFTIWRGASYLPWFNWVCAAVFFIFTHTGINYRMILMKNGYTLQKYQSFIWTASLLSAIYLSLFLIYLLHALNYIKNQPWLNNLGYLMWIINLVFMLNPLKILNYYSRRYFIYMLWRNIICLFTKMDMNIFFLAIILASCAQPMNDLVFMLCTLKNYNQAICQKEGIVGTFVYMMIFFFYRVVQSVRLQIQFGEGKVMSRGNFGMAGVIFATNAVASGYIYGGNDSRGMLIYWIIASGLNTIAACHTDFRADWGIIGFDEEDCLLRKYIHFGRKTFYIWMIIDCFLNIVWVLTISNNLRAFLSLNVLYFFMVLSYIQFARKGIWMSFRVEEDHSLNVGNLRSMYTDQQFWEEVQQVLGKQQEIKKENSLNQSRMALQHKVSREITLNDHVQPEPEETQNIGSMNTLLEPWRLSPIKQKAEQEVIKLQDIQAMIKTKKTSLLKVKSFLFSLQGYLDIIHKIYQQLDWQDEY